MVHVFKALSRFFALDANSGAVHLLDDISYDLLSLMQSGLSANEARQRLSKYSTGDLDDAILEIEALQQGGQLFSRHDYAAFAPEQGEKTPLKALCLHAAHDCDLRCRYCFAGTGGFSGPRGLMPYEVGVKALDFLFENSGERKVLEVDFFGGEPLLNWDVVKRLVEYARLREPQVGKRINFTITTNGMGLNDEIINFVNLEMENVVLSIDGRPKVNDAMRPTADGKGSYATILPLFKKLVEGRNGKSWYVRGTFTRKNLDFSNDVLHLCDEGFDQISVEPAALPAQSPLSILEEHLPEIMQEYETLAEALLQRHNNGRPVTFFHFLIDLENGPCIKKRLSGCGAGREYLAVTPEGDLYPCHQFVGREGYKLGTVFEGIAETAQAENFAACHVLNKPECGKCWAALFCTGGCAANAHAFMGDIMKPWPIECAMEKKRLECAIATKAAILEGVSIHDKEV